MKSQRLHTALSAWMRSSHRSTWRTQSVRFVCPPADLKFSAYRESQIRWINLSANPLITELDVYLSGELLHAFDLSKPKLVFVSPFVAKKIIDVCRQLKFVQHVVLIDGQPIDDFVISASDLVKTHKSIRFHVDDFVCEEVDVRDQVAMIFCSSGTTGELRDFEKNLRNFKWTFKKGLPKGVLTTQENMMACLQTYRTGMKHIADTHNISIVALNVAPWFHVLGFLSMFMYSCLKEHLFVFLPKFDEAAYYKAIEVSELKLFGKFAVNRKPQSNVDLKKILQISSKLRIISKSSSELKIFFKL